MIKKDQERKELKDNLEKVKQRIQILDMIEKKLFQMKELSQKVIDEDLPHEVIQK